MRLGTEFVGKLPPDAQAMLDHTLESWRQSALVTGVEVLAAPDCEVAAKFAGMIFPLSSPPQFPLAGCDRSPCCACCYSSVLDDEGGAGAKPIGLHSEWRRLASPR
jgi:hypothetical protein